MEGPAENPSNALRILVPPTRTFASTSFFRNVLTAVAALSAWSPVHGAASFGHFRPCDALTALFVFLGMHFLRSILSPPDQPATQRPVFPHTHGLIGATLEAIPQALSAGATAPCFVLEKTPKKFQ